MRISRHFFLIAMVFAGLTLGYSKDNPKDDKTLRLRGAGSLPASTSRADKAFDRSSQKVFLRGKTIDTKEVPSSSAKQMRTTAGRPSGKSLFIVQFKDTIRPDYLEKISRRDVQILQYLPNNAYLVFGHPEKMPKAAEAPEVSWAGGFERAEKIHPKIRQKLAARTATAPTAAEPLEPVIVQYFAHDELGETASALKAYSKQAFQPFKVANHYTVRMLVRPADIESLAMLPLVYNIEPQPQYQLLGERQALIMAKLADPAGTSIPAPATGSRYDDFLADKGLDGSGLVVAMLDDGLDTGNTTNQPGSAHPDLVGRIEGAMNFTSDPSGGGLAGHGTFNAGIIMGQPKANATFVDGRWLGRVDAQGFQLGQGIAPGARILSGKIFRDSGAYDGGGRTFAQMLSEMASHNPVVMSNSWGADTEGAYTADSADFDALVRDYNANLAGDQPLPIFFAAGNQGDSRPDSRQTIGTPATGKNVVAVGATENTDASGTDGCFLGPADADNARDLARFSSRGPTEDGRFGVTLVAPGSHVYAIAPMLSTFDGSGVCGAAGNNFAWPPTDAYYPTGQTDYTWSSGTSHSTPAVAAAATLYIDWYRKEFDRSPSPALVKAALVNSCVASPGDLNHPTAPAPHIPNPDSGWGRTSLENLIPDAGESRAQFIADQDYVFTASGQMREYVITAIDSSQPLKITLNWTDAPALPGINPSLINDLDLKVIKGSEVYWGNAFEAGQSITGGSADRLNNTECVFIPNPSGTYRVQIHAALIAGNAIPSHAGMLDQDFALLVSGGLNDTPKGMLLFDQPRYAPNGTVNIQLVDSGLRGQSSASVSVRSNAAGPMNVNLSPVIAGGGVFEGTLALSPTAEAGKLLVAHGNTITGTYDDPDDGSGAPAVATATAIVDGQGPVISEIEVKEISWDSAKITFRTNEQTTAIVQYGLDCAALDKQAQAVRLHTRHSIPLGGLAKDTIYRFKITATDSTGNSTEGECLAFRSARKICTPMYTQEGGSQSPFTHQATAGADTWTIANTSYAHSPSNAWYCQSQTIVSDSSLILPLGLLLPKSSLIFWHTFNFEAEYDGAILEVSTDGGVSWQDLKPQIVKGGYNALLRQTSNPLGARLAWSGGTIDTMTRVEVDLSTLAGQTASVRWRVGTDVGTGGEGWLIDDIRVCSAVGSRAAIEVDAPAYRSGQEMKIFLSDADLAGLPTAFVEVRTTSEATAESVPLQALGSGHFSGKIDVTSEVVAGDGRAGVVHGDVITATYMDSDAGTSAQYLATATATADLQCVTLVDSGVTDITSRGAFYTVKTDEPAQITVRVDSTKEERSWTFQTPTAVSEWQFWLHELTPCTLFHVTVTTSDALGNTCSTSENNARFRLTTPDEQTVFTDTMETPNAQWTHGATKGPDDWIVALDEFAKSPVKSWQALDTASLTDKWLRLPPLEIQQGDMLLFWHTYAFEATGTKYFDGGMVEISTDGVTWQDLEPGFLYETAYDGPLSTEYDNPLKGRKAFSGGALGQMKLATISLDNWQGANRHIRFRIACDSSFGAAGWRIDDVQVVHQIPCDDTETGARQWEVYR